MEDIPVSKGERKVEMFTVFRKERPSFEFGVPLRKPFVFGGKKDLIAAKRQAQLRITFCSNSFFRKDPKDLGIRTDGLEGIGGGPIGISWTRQVGVIF